MSSNLEEKFTALEDQLATQNAAILEAMTATNAKLDALLEAFGVPPPTATVTLADIKDVLDDIHADTQSIDLKLLRVRDAIAPLGEDLPTDDKSAMAWSLYRLMDATAPAWPRPTSAPIQPSLELLRQAFADVVGINADGTTALTVLGRLTSLLDTTDNIENNIGQPTGDATTTVLGRLAAIERLSECGCGPQPPDPTDPDGCADPFVSSAPSASIAAYPGRSFAVFHETPPDGLLITDSMDLGVANVEISPEATWTGWRVFVLSKASAYYSEDPTRTGLWPTNTWRDLDEAQSFALAFSVPAGDITVYLCGPTDVPPEIECTTIESQSVTIVGFGARQAIVWPEPFTSSSTDEAGNSYSANQVLIGDYQNWTIRVVTGAGARLVLFVGATNSNVFIDGGDTTTISTTTTSLFLDDLNYGGAFSIEICPPA